jgi:hypothetical protein
MGAEKLTALNRQFLDKSPQSNAAAHGVGQEKIWLWQVQCSGSGHKRLHVALIVRKSVHMPNQAI